MTLPITLSIVSHGHGPLLRRFLAQLDAAPTLAGIHVVVTLNLANESFDASPYSSLRITVLRNASPRGFGANHNEASRHGATPFLAVLNPDLALSGGEPFTLMVRRLSIDRESAIVVPVVRNADGGREDAVRGNLTPWSLIARQLLGRRAALASATRTGLGKPFFWAAGMCLVIDAAAYASIGGFDERFFLYCEDYDLCARMHLSGRSISVEPSAEIIHDAQRDSHLSSRHLGWHLQSLLKVWTSCAFWRVTLGA